MRTLISIFSCLIMIVLPVFSQNSKPIRLAVAGVTHGHAGFIFGRKPANDLKLVGVFDSNTDLARRYSDQYGFNVGIIYSSLEKMLDEVKPDAVVAFGTIYDHMVVVEACAPRKIHVMVEKPLATTADHAQRMTELAKKYNIHLLTNYETSWYPSTAKMFQLVNDSNYVGKLRKAVFHHGHEGPKEIGVGKEFFEWLTNPVLNGGGAVTDFGCYGANIMTALMRDIYPISVLAVTRQFKPGIYPDVDDDATIIVNYPSSQCIIQASWNWPFSRKDMEIYGETGFVFALNNSEMVLRNKQSLSEQRIKITAKDLKVYEDPFSYFAGVIRGEIKMSPYSLYSPENNLIVVQILEAAKESARTGKVIIFKN